MRHVFTVVGGNGVLVFVIPVKWARAEFHVKARIPIHLRTLLISNALSRIVDRKEGMNRKSIGIESETNYDSMPSEFLLSFENVGSIGDNLQIPIDLFLKWAPLAVTERSGQVINQAARFFACSNQLLLYCNQRR